MALSATQLREQRMRGQLLQPRSAPHTTVSDIIKQVGAVQAQELAAANLSIWVRNTALVHEHIDHARLVERSIVRTWAMRGTLHLLAAEDMGWLIPLLGPRFIAADNRRCAELGLDEATIAKGIGALRKQLAAQGPLTRAEIVQQLQGYGVKLVGQAAPHLLSRAALEGLICYGPERGNEPTYVLLDDWLGGFKVAPLEDGTAELTRRYLAAYGPASAEDMAAWSGLPLSEIRRAWQSIASELIEVASSEGPLWMLQDKHTRWLDESPSLPQVRLLPAFDTYLLGYRNRELLIAPEYARRVHPGGGIIHAVLLADGLAQGTWRSKIQRGKLAVSIAPFGPLDSVQQQALAHEVEALGRFFALEASFTMST